MEKKIDWITFALYLAILAFGWVNLYAACYDGVHTDIFDITRMHGKQLLWIGISLILAFIIMMIKPRVIASSSYLIYLIVMVIMLITPFIARSVNGGRSWINFGFFKFQAAEFSKVATALAVAYFVNGIDIDMRQLKNQLIAWCIILVPVGLTLLQHDTGSALVFSAFIFPMFREGMSPAILVIGFAAILLFVLALLVNKYIIIGGLAVVALLYLFLWLNKRNRRIYTRVVMVFLLACSFTLSVDFVFEHVLEAHQRDRIYVLLGKSDDIKDIGYNQHQSKIAIGSGGVTGKGFLDGTITKADFVPKQETDFIFCTVGEEWGFLGATALIIVYILFILRIITLAERQYSTYSRFYGYSVASILFLHFFINIGMALGLLPVVGIPLPFFSYGGSSLMAFTLMLFIFLQQDRERNNSL